MFNFRNFGNELKARKLPKSLAIYLSSGITVLGVTNLFLSVYKMPVIIFDCVLTILLCALPGVLIFAWYHGGVRKNKIKKQEYVVYFSFLIIAFIIILKLTGTPGTRLLPRDSNSIAVLPFTNLSLNHEDEYFSDGITEDILTQICKIKDLKVISRTSVMQYKNTKKNLKQIGDELGVAVILEGSVRREENRVRISSQLIDARSDEHIWAETYDFEIKDIFTIQSEVAREIAQALKATISPQEISQLEKKSTTNVEAYGYYLRGREYYYEYNKDSNERAIELFIKAVIADSNYALAYAGLADAYGRNKYYDYSTEWNDSSLMYAKKALRLDPDLAEGYKALGDAYNGKNESNLALIQYIKAATLNPNYATAISNTGYIYYQLGSFDEALIWMKKAMIIEPGTARWKSNVGLQYFCLGYDSLAALWLNKALDLQPEFFFPSIILSYIDVYKNNYNAARVNISRLIVSNPDVPVIYVCGGDVEMLDYNFKKAEFFFKKAADLSSYRSEAGIKLAFVLTELNNKDMAKTILKWNLPVDEKGLDEYKESISTYYLSAAYCMAGDYKMAINSLKKAVQLGYRDYRWLKIDPLFKAIRNEPEFISISDNLKILLNKMRERVYNEKL